MLNVEPLMKAIEGYIAKVEEGLEEQLTMEGFLAAAEAVRAIDRLEDSIRDITQGHVDEVVGALKTDGGLSTLLGVDIMELDSVKELEAALYMALRTEYDEMVRHISFAFVGDGNPDLDVTDKSITKRTQATICDASETYSKTTTKWVEPKLVNMIREEYEAGNTVEGITRKIHESGIRDTAWKARRLALTEVLRMESIGQQESFFQDPEVAKKEWVYTWAAKDPRENHIAMNGQTVPYDKPFDLAGADGGSYGPMFPRDSCLPAGETINCHCIMRPVRDSSSAGMSEAEKRQLRQDILDDEDRKWREEHKCDNVNMIKGLSEEEQIRYFGGKKKAEPYRSLIRSGAIETDYQLERLYYFDKTGKRCQKDLNSLHDCGIFTVSDGAMKHTMIGDISGIKDPSKPRGGENGGYLRKGGHAYQTMQWLEDNGFEYRIKKTYDNGVVIGGYEGAKAKSKRLKGSSMSWFPETWDSTQIRDAGTYVANNYAESEKLFSPDGKFTGYKLYANYDGVTVGVVTDTKRKIDTIFPDEKQRLIGGADD